ncbi:MAG TPA: 50S ribosomal protein L11 methyltransferase [Sedimenticola sp.]|nr:50S ribosomal protein L11 methyltransferase [Sedimenticola sp.]
MPWLQLHVTTDRETAPLAEHLLGQLGALSITLGDAADEPLLEPAPGESPLWRHTRVTGLFPGDRDVERLCQALRQKMPVDAPWELQPEHLADRVWERAWLDDFRPMRFGERLWVCPDGRTPGDRDAVVVELDPGLAFGTGTHPTTALCLRWLDAEPLAGRQLLDFGCGSGILSLAALKLGAAGVTAVDHDPQALEATRDNATRNRVAERLQVCDSGNLPQRRFDLIVANILAGTLTTLEPVIAGHLRPGGRLALSGILQTQAAAVSDAYGAHFRMEPPLVLDDWVLLPGQRRAAD